MSERQLRKLKEARLKLYNDSYSIKHVIEDILDILEEHLKGVK